MRKKPVVLMILDGYGLNDKMEGNAVREAKTPVMDQLMKEYQMCIRDRHIQGNGDRHGKEDGQIPEGMLTQVTG